MNVFVRPLRPDELFHHGIDGQKWGVQNGPPYPLSNSISTGKRLKNTDTKKKKYKSKSSTQKIKAMPKEKAKKFAVDKEKVAKYIKTGAKITAGIAIAVASKGLINPLASSAFLVAGRPLSDKIIDSIGDAVLKKG